MEPEREHASLICVDLSSVKNPKQEDTCGKSMFLK